MRVLELFCGAGLAARGIIQAGATCLLGVDKAPQPRYPGLFLLDDALNMHTSRDAFIQWCRRNFDFIWASPPCQFATALRFAHNAKPHKNLIPRTRRLLLATGLPFVIENVEQARPYLRNPVMLCGTHFKLHAIADGICFDLQRHRLFETNWTLDEPRQCVHRRPAIGIYGGHARCRSAKAGGRGTRDFVGLSQRELAATALGVTDPALTLMDMSQGIPPAYAKYILTQWKAQA